jgi:hypothetical protein
MMIRKRRFSPAFKRILALILGVCLVFVFDMGIWGSASSSGADQSGGGNSALGLTGDMADDDPEKDPEKDPEEAPASPADDRPDENPVASLGISLFNIDYSDVIVEGYKGVYTGGGKRITVKAPEGATVDYGTVSNTTYPLTEAPLYYHAGTWTTYFRVTFDDGRPQYYGTADVVIEKRDLHIAVDNAEKAYGKEDPDFTGKVSNLAFPVDLTSVTYHRAPADENKENIGDDIRLTATCQFRAAAAGDYNVIITEGKLTIKPGEGLYDDVIVEGYRGILNGGGRRITVTAPEGATVAFGTVPNTSYPLTEAPLYYHAGTWTTYFRVTFNDGRPQYYGTADVVLDKRDVYVVVDNAEKAYGKEDPDFTGTVTNLAFPVDLTSVTYHRAPEDESKENIGDDIRLTATCQFRTAAAGDYNVIITEGKLTIKSGGALNITSAGYEGVYDGKPHGITVTAPAGATVMYGTDPEKCDKNDILYTNAGSYTVYYRVTQAGFEPASGFNTVDIAQKSAGITVNSASKTYGAKDPAYTGTVSGLVSDGDLGAVTYGRDPADAGKENVGDSITITAFYSDNPNYKVTVKTASLSITSASGLSVSVSPYRGTYDGKPHGITVTAPAGATITYGTGVSATAANTANPQYTNAGTYTVYYTVTYPNYQPVSGSSVVSLVPKGITVTANSAEYTYDRTTKVLSGIKSVEGLLDGHVLTGVSVPAVSRLAVGSAPLVVSADNWRVTHNNVDMTGNYTLKTVNGLLVINPPNYQPSSPSGTSSPDTDPIPVPLRTIMDTKTPLTDAPVILDGAVPTTNLPKTGGAFPAYMGGWDIWYQPCDVSPRRRRWGDRKCPDEEEDTDTH